MRMVQLRKGDLTLSLIHIWYLKFIASETNQTYTSLTEKGILYCKKSNELKEKIEQEITESLGEENIKLIKKLFEREWIK